MLGEFALERGPLEDWHLSQYAIGLSSRGVSLGYHRDRPQGQPSAGVWRLGGSANLGQGAFGTAVTFHDGGRAWDAGIRYSPGARLHLAGVVRNIGRPAVRDSVLRVTLVAGLALQAGGWRVSGETVAVERRPVAGYQLSYRTGLQLALPLRWRASAVTALALDEHLAVRRWTVGLALGAPGQFTTAATGAADATRLETISVSAVSARIVR